ncbi:MAG: FtsX-like permease family protein, partial [Myxococcales bacterium]
PGRGSYRDATAGEAAPADAPVEAAPASMLLSTLGMSVRAITEQVSGISAIAPVVGASALVVAGNRNYTTSVQGSTNAWLTVRGWALASGRAFSETELSGGTPACILGATVSKQLFGSQDPLGATLRVGAVACSVVGLLATKGQSTFGQDQDNLMLMPMPVVQRRLAGKTTIDSFMVSVAPGRSSDRVVSQLQQLLRERRRVAPGQEDNFDVFDMKEMAKSLGSITTTLTGLLGGIAAVSLLVGGIGIMNIMLVSVTERTREIGTRLAIGALGREVMMQFLVEAVMLSLLGGLIGVLLGLGGSFAVTHALGLPFTVLPSIVLVAFAFSAAVGVAFGYLPARQAANLNPIDALRHE